MRDESSPTDKQRDLLKILLDNKLISSGQAEVAQLDENATGMTIEEILLLRGWVTEEQLSRLAPWLKTGDDPETAGGKTYQENLRAYRQLMTEILGETE